MGPGFYAQHPGLEHERDDEPTMRTKGALDMLPEPERLYLLRKIYAPKTVPPPAPTTKYPVGAIVAPMVVSVFLGVGSAVLAMYRADAVTEERQATTGRRIDQIDADLRAHASGTHPAIIEATARTDAKLDALTRAVDRIERQLDAQPRRQR